MKNKQMKLGLAELQVRQTFKVTMSQYYKINFRIKMN